jgi:glycine cleavage system H protein
MTPDNVPEDRRYTPSHEWVRADGEDLVVGVTDYAQQQLTDVVFVDLPEAGKSVQSGASVLVLESVKTVSDIYAPAEGTVSAVNRDLTAHPEWVNQDPYGRGWIFRLKPTRPFDLSTLLDAAGYRALVSHPP